MSNLSKKKLLVLGGGAAAYAVVKTAKEMGIYVISVDYLDGGSAKEIADEQYKISTTDFEALLKLIKEKRIDGVFAGASEFNIQNMIKLTSMAGLPCYCTQEQWDLMQEKRHYKETCRKYGVPVVPEFSLSEDPLNIKYPVIVKPTDGSSSRGISLVKCAQDLPSAIDYAKEYSVCKDVIIERFMDCKDITAFYTIQNGEPSLSHMVDIFRYNNRDGIPTITSCLLYPSHLLEAYKKKMDPQIKAMLKGIGMKDGFADFQIFTENEEFYAFECCLRIPGNYDYPTIERVNDINYMKMMIEYAVSGSMGNKVAADYNDPSFYGMYAANLAIMLRDGEIGSVSGIEDVMKHRNILSMNAPSYEIGSVVKPESIGTLNQTYTRFHLIGNSFEDLKSTIHFIFDTVKVLDTNGNNMLYSNFDWNGLEAWNKK